MSKLLWIILLILTGAMVLWWGGSAASSLWKYGRLATEAPASATHYEVVPKGSKYALEVRYTYVYQGHTYSGKTLFAKPYYLNHQAATDAKKSLEGMQWTAWVNPHHPEISSIQKIFPFKTTVYAVIVLGIFIYFCFLYWYSQLSARE